MPVHGYEYACSELKDLAQACVCCATISNRMNGQNPFNCIE